MEETEGFSTALLIWPWPCNIALIQAFVSRVLVMFDVLQNKKECIEKNIFSSAFQRTEGASVSLSIVSGVSCFLSGPSDHICLGYWTFPRCEYSKLFCFQDVFFNSFALTSCTRPCYTSTQHPEAQKGSASPHYVSLLRSVQAGRSSCSISNFIYFCIIRLTNKSSRASSQNLSPSVGKKVMPCVG